MNQRLCVFRRCAIAAGPRFRLRGLIAAAAAAVVWGGPLPAAGAAPITFYYGGAITQADAGTGAAPGDRFNGTFTYDPQAAPFYMTVENGRFYSFGESSPGARPTTPPPDASAASLTIGGGPTYSRQGGLALSVYEVDSGGRAVLIPSDGAAPVPYARSVFEINTSDGLRLSLVNPNRVVFGSLDVPTAINLADFPEATIGRAWWDADSQTRLGYRGTIDELRRVEQHAIPEPAAVALWLGLGAAGWAVGARARGGRRFR